MTNGIQRLLI